MNGYIRLAGIDYESLVNGPGLRRVLFAQHCKHNCPGCFNPETHSKYGGSVFEIKDIIDNILNSPIKAVTFSGGDPFEQASEFAAIATALKLCNKDFSIWCYTGYTFDFILDNLDKRDGFKELLYSIDVLVDGPFILSKKDSSLLFRGSSNQRLIDVQKSLSTNSIIEFSY